MSASPIRMFCLECGFKSRACARLTRDGRCPSPKVYTIDDTSRRAVARMWRREREKEERGKTPPRRLDDVDDDDDVLSRLVGRDGRMFRGRLVRLML